MKRLIYILLGLLGFTSCEHFIGAEEYGVPHVSFSLKARVVDEAGVPIQGIEVRTEGDGRFEYNTGFSDYQGYIDAYGGFWPGTEHGKVQFIDIDGEANGGEFETLTVDIENATQTEEDSGHWYHGAYTADLGTVTMKLKEKGEETPDETPEETPAE
jgi:putative lipoprotein (rSAM/lipoprotein system)